MGGPGRDLSKELFGDSQPPALGGRDLSKELFGSEAKAPAASAAPAATPAPALPALADWQKQLKRVKTHNGFDSVQRYDGGVWYGPAQGNPGEGGWFDAEGNRLPLDPEASILPKPVEAVVRTLARPFERTIEGAAQLDARMKGNPEAVQRTQAAINANEADYQRNGYQGPGSGALEFAGGVLQPIPGMGGPLGTGRAAIAKGLLKATGVGAATAATQPVYGDGQDFWAQKGTQAGVGAVLAPLTQFGVEKGLVPVVNRGITAVSGKMTPAIQALQDLADRLGIRTSAGDLSASPGMKKTEVLLESVPGAGMGKFRMAQNQEAGAAAGKLAQDLQEAMRTEGWSNLAEVKAAAAKGRKGAQALLDQLANAGDDWERVVQASGNLKAFAAKLKADSLYDRVEQLSAQHGEVPLINTLRALEDVKRELAAAHLPDASVQKIVSTLESRLKATDAPQVGQVAAQVRQAVGAPPVVQAPAQSVVDNSFSGLRQLRSDLGSLVTDATKGGGEITGTRAAAALGRLRTAVEQDMESFAKTNGPELAKAWREADSYYRTAVVPYKDRALAKALTEGHPDEIFGQFIKAGKGDRAQRFYDNLDPKGQAAVRVGLVQNALEKATSTKPGAEGSTIFSPAQFAGYLEKMGDATGMAFKGQDKWEIDGLTKLMRHIERSGQFAENPPTGNRLMPFAVAGAAKAFGALPEAATALLTAKGLQKILTTPAGKRFLLAASDLQPGSKAMQSFVQSRLPALVATTTEARTPKDTASSDQ